MKRKLKSRAARGKIVIKMISSSVRIVELSGLKQESDRLGGVTACSFHCAALPALHCNRAYCSALHCTGLHWTGCIALPNFMVHYTDFWCIAMWYTAITCNALTSYWSLHCAAPVCLMVAAERERWAGVSGPQGGMGRSFVEFICWACWGPGPAGCFLYFYFYIFLSLPGSFSNHFLSDFGFYARLPLSSSPYRSL